MHVPLVLPGVDWDQYYYNKAPHLLDLLRFYAVGKRSRKPMVTRSDIEKMESISISAGAIELAEMGIFLTANETTELPDMGIDRKWIIFAELSMASLSLNDARASWLVNMAALELCTTTDFFFVKEDSAVCSYLRLLCMMVHREEDVQELRAKGILQGAGLTNNETLDFFIRFQGLPYGLCYARVFYGIDTYRVNRWISIMVHTFVYRNNKTILTTFSVLNVVASILGTLKSLLKAGRSLP